MRKELLGKLNTEKISTWEEINSDKDFLELRNQNEDLKNTIKYLTDLFSSDSEKNKNTKPQLLLKVSALE